MEKYAGIAARLVLMALLLGGTLTGAKGKTAENTNTFAESVQMSAAAAQDENLTAERDSSAAPQKAPDVEAESAAELVPDADKKGEIESMADGREILHFVDAFGAPYLAELNPNVERNVYDRKAFSRDGDRLSYADNENFTIRQGLDVCHHNGTIDWEKVKNAGFEFVFIRLGYRGYGQEGIIRLDREFENNMRGAREAGLDIGIYFYAQAVNEEEAREEAEFVLENLAEYELELPVVYDPENVLDAEARTDDVSGERFTENTKIFCSMIAQAGYQPAVYCNMLWEAYTLDLEQLADWPIWYADYESRPQTPYRFTFWQYTSEGSVDGIAGPVDLDIQILPG